jgi:competence protein ComEC
VPLEGRWQWLDLRLVPAAAAVWAVCLAAPFLDPWPLVAGAVGALGAAECARRRSTAGATTLLAVLAAVALTCGTAAVRGAAREASPLRAPADAHGAATVDLRLDGDPHLLAGSGRPRIVADATVIALHEEGQVRHLDAAVLLFAPEKGWRELLPGQPVRARVLASPPRAGDDVVAVLSARGPPDRVGEPGSWQRLAGGLRDGLTDAARRTLDPRPAGLLPGLVVGDTRHMDPLLVEDFRQAGLSHLTAVSGANVAIVIAAVLWPLRRRAVDRRVQAALAAAALVCFVVLARPEPSVLRAAAMGAVTLLALASGRPRVAVPALAAAVCVLLHLDPGLARDPGFALSVLATAAIVLLAPIWSRRLRSRGWPTLVADALAVSAAAGLATAPLVAALSGSVSLVSLPANLLAAPAVAPATVLGLLATVVGAVSTPAGDVLVRCAGWPTRWLVLVAERAAQLPDAAPGWPAGLVGAALLTVLLAAVGWALWRFRRLRPLALAALTGLLLIGWPVRQVVRGWPLPDTVVVACDVGQGDALVLPTDTAGEAVLVDAGPDIAAVDRCLDAMGVERLPLVLLSHLDADHVGGLAGALDGRVVRTVATGALSPADDRVRVVDALIRRAGAERIRLVPGDRREVGAVTLEVLAPEPERATAAAEANDLSLVARATVRGVRVLLTGDLGAEAEARLRTSGIDLRAEVLKVPHHGSADADAGFLAASGARTALISVGADNTYGHPARSLLETLARAGMRVHRTDQQGDVAVVGSAEEWGVAARGRAASGRRPARRNRAGMVAPPWHHAGVPAAASVPPLSRLRVVTGEEELLRARAVSAVRTAVVQRHPDAELHELAAQGLPPGQLADVLAPSLFGGHRLVVVTGVHESAAALADALTAYAKDPDPEITLVIVHSGGKRNEALVKAFVAAGAAVDECPKISSAGDRAAFVRNEVRTFGGRITADALTALVDAVGNDLRALSAAASQLVSDFGGTIDGDAVARFHRGQAEVTGFTVAERVLVGDRQGSIEMLRWALERGVAHVLIADAIADGVRTAARVASLSSTNPGELARTLKMPPWKVKKAQAQSRGWSIDGLQQAIAVTAELNADVKGVAASADYALERAVRRIVDIRATTGRGRAAAGR